MDSTFEIIATFVTDLFYHKLYAAAFKLFRGKNEHTLREHYSFLLSDFVDNIRVHEHYLNFLRSLICFKQKYSHSRLTFSQEIDSLCKVFVPGPEYQKLDHQAKESLVQYVLRQTILIFAAETNEQRIPSILDRTNAQKNAQVINSMRDSIIDRIVQYRDALGKNLVMAKCSDGNAQKMSINREILDLSKTKLRELENEKKDLYQQIVSYKQMSSLYESQMKKEREKNRKLQKQISQLSSELREAKKVRKKGKLPKIKEEQKIDDPSEQFNFEFENAGMVDDASEVQTAKSSVEPFMELDDLNPGINGDYSDTEEPDPKQVTEIKSNVAQQKLKRCMSQPFVYDGRSEHGTTGFEHESSLKKMFI